MLFPDRYDRMAVHRKVPIHHPVSYTHLAGQIRTKWFRNLLIFRLNRSLNTDKSRQHIYRGKSVSYTHLDVYKRQPSPWGIFCYTDGGIFYGRIGFGVNNDSSYGLSQFRLDPENFLTKALEIEKQLGRVRHSGQQYKSRTIDIDILFCDSLLIHTENIDSFPTDKPSGERVVHFFG